MDKDTAALEKDLVRETELLQMARNSDVERLQASHAAEVQRLQVRAPYRIAFIALLSFPRF